MCSMLRKTRVKSSVIAAVEYNPNTQVLEIQFHAGRTYDYLKVPREIYQSLLTAESVGNTSTKPSAPTTAPCWCGIRMGGWGRVCWGSEGSRSAHRSSPRPKPTHHITPFPLAISSSWRCSPRMCSSMR